MLLTLADHVHEFHDLVDICLAGEACTVQIARLFAGRYKVGNMYGMTEATIDSTYVLLDKDCSFVSIGAPLPSISLHAHAHAQAHTHTHTHKHTHTHTHTLTLTQTYTHKHTHTHTHTHHPHTCDIPLIANT